MFCLGLRFGGFARKLSRDIQGWKTALSAIVRRVCMITLQGAGAFQASGSSQLVELFIDSVAATLWISWVFGVCLHDQCFCLVSSGLNAATRNKQQTTNDAQPTTNHKQQPADHKQHAKHSTRRCRVSAKENRKNSKVRKQSIYIYTRTKNHQLVCRFIPISHL